MSYSLLSLSVFTYLPNIGSTSVPRPTIFPLKHERQGLLLCLFMSQFQALGSSEVKFETYFAKVVFIDRGWGVSGKSSCEFRISSSSGRLSTSSISTTCASCFPTSEVNLVTEVSSKGSL